MQQISKVVTGLNLSPGFNFGAFKQVTPIDTSTLWELIFHRHASRISVKRPAAAMENLQKIFEATFRLANKVGFGAMTLRDLCRETGMSTGGLYGYIASKDDLAAMIEDVIRHIGTAIPTWFEAQPSAIDRLDSNLRGHIFLSELLQPWFYFVFMESRTLPAGQRAVARSSELEFQQEIARLIAAAGPADGAQAELLAAHCQAMIQDWHVKRWKYKQQKINVDLFADSMSRVVRLAVGAPAN